MRDRSSLALRVGFALRRLRELAELAAAKPTLREQIDEEVRALHAQLDSLLENHFGAQPAQE